MPLEQEQKWIRAILRRGDRQAADLLIRRYYDEIFAFMYRQSGDREDALDLTQECFIAALGSLHTYDRRKAAFRTWLYHIAVHKLIDRRRRSRPVTVPLEQDTPVPGDFTALLEDRELLRRAGELVCQADSLDQEIFRLRLYAERSFPDIAAVCGQSEAMVKSRYYRLLAYIRKELTEHDP